MYKKRKERLKSLAASALTSYVGRFSKVGWLKFDDLPPSLRSIKFGYHETGSYHSWTLDHLQNIVSLLGLYPQKLEHFSVTRLVPLPALLPGRHAMFPELGCNNRTAPQRISKQHILSIVADGKSLNELNLDWWLISVEGLEVIVKGLPNLRKLTALVDAPFHRIVRHNPIIFVTLCIYHKHPCLHVFSFCSLIRSPPPCLFIVKFRS
jgi:hypothetical protein